VQQNRGSYIPRHLGLGAWKTSYFLLVVSITQHHRAPRSAPLTSPPRIDQRGSSCTAPVLAVCHATRAFPRLGVCLPPGILLKANFSQSGSHDNVCSTASWHTY
jgi:hypothetical protein